MGRLVVRYLPVARITHPYPNVRFRRSTYGKSRVRQFRTLGSVGAPGNRHPYRDR